MIKSEKIIFIALLVAFSQQSSNCAISLYSSDETNWGDLAYGFTWGLYQNPPDDCTYCQVFSSIVGSFQSNFISVEDKRSLWVNGVNSFSGLTTTQKISQLTTVFLLFYNAAIHVDTFFENNTIKNFVPKITARFDDSFAETLQTLVFENSVALFLLWSSAPGANCQSIGIRMGASLRKMKYTAVCLFIIMAFSYSQQTQLCNITLFAYDQDNWGNMSYGFAAGLYNDLPDPCSICSTLSSNMRAVNKGYIYMELMRSSWVNKSTVLNTSVLKLATTLLTLFAMFYDFFYNIDQIYQNKVIMTIPETIVAMLSDSEQQAILYENINDKFQAIIYLATTVPGQSCYQIGYRSGATLRYMFGVSYD